jgi:hypothetical protein
MCWPPMRLPARCHQGSPPGENFLRWRLLAPAARDFFVDWDEATEVAVSGLRESVAGDLGDPRLRGLIEELSASRHSADLEGDRDEQ